MVCQEGERGFLRDHRVMSESRKLGTSNYVAKKISSVRSREKKCKKLQKLIR